MDISKKIRYERGEGKLVLLVRPEDFGADLLERLAEADDGGEEAVQARCIVT